MSINTIPPSPPRMSSIADSPVWHSPAMTKSSVAARAAAVASRKLAWSSTTQTRTRSSATLASCGADLPHTMVYTPHSLRVYTPHFPSCAHHAPKLSQGAVVEEHQHRLDPPINRVVDGQA